MADQKAPQMQATLGPHRIDQQRNGADCSRRLSMANVLHPGNHGHGGPAFHRAGDVVGHPAGASDFAWQRRWLTRKSPSFIPARAPATTTPSRRCSRKDKAFKYARIAKFIVGWGSHLYYWVYPGVMVATTGIFVGYVVGFLLPQLHQRVQSGTGLHGPGRDCVFVLCRLDRTEGRGRIDRSKHRHQHRADLGAAGVQRAGAGLSRQPSRRCDRRSTTMCSRLRPIPISLPPSPRMAPSSAMPTARRAPTDSAGKPVPFTIDYPAKDASGNMLTHTYRQIRCLSAQIQLGIHSGHCRHSDPGGI